MANLISWGIIYCSSWFGQTDETTLSIQNESAPPCFAPANEIVDQYVTRVETDGGVVEGYDCLVAAIQDLGEDTYYDIFDTVRFGGLITAGDKYERCLVKKTAH